MSWYSFCCASFFFYTVTIMLTSPKLEHLCKTMMKIAQKPALTNHSYENGNTFFIDTNFYQRVSPPDF